LGVRIPDHWFSDIVEKLNKPIVTTSVNLAGQPPAKNLEDLQEFNVDFIIYEGEKPLNPSTIFDSVSGKVIKR